MTTSTPSSAEAAAPSVVAVVVSRDPGEWFEESLSSIVGQDYPDLAVLVIDAGSETSLAERVAGTAPDAFVHRMTGSPGFSAAANQAAELVSSNDFFLFCHDDVRLDRRCLAQLVEEVFRSNAGVVGPKLVDWHDDRRLTQLGMGSDRFGVQTDRVERGEFDQQQYDAVRDVFVVPGGVQLIRRDLFDELDGFDPAIESLGEDLDLCWRAQALGARVLVSPQARAAHLEGLGTRGVHDRRARLTRHRLRTMLVTTHGGALALTLPLALLLIVAEAAYSVVAGRRGQARDMLSAIGWNLSRWSETSERRAELTERRRRSVSEVRQLQSGGSARISGFIRGRIDDRQDRLADLVGSVRASFGGGEAATLRDATMIGLVTFAIVVGGLRGLITGGVEPFGRIPDFDGGWGLLREWWSGWRSIGLGGDEASPPGQFVLGLIRFSLGWTGGLGATLVSVGPALLAPIVAWRATRPLGSPRASAAAALVVGANPMLPALMAAGRWDALVAVAGLPLLLGAVLRVEGLAPFGTGFGAAGPTVVERPLSGRLIRLGLATAIIGALVPTLAVLVVVTVLAVMVGGLVSARPERLGQLALAIPTVLVVAVAVWAPWSVSLLDGDGWSWLVGVGSPEASADSMLDLLRFGHAGLAPGWTGLATVAAAAVSIVLARGQRFDVAARAWAVALVAFVLGWVGLRGWSPIELPATEMWLALALAALAFVVAAGIRAAELDAEVSWAFRPQLLITLVATLSLVAMLVSGLRHGLEGRWGAPELAFGDFTELIVASETGDVGAARVLWIGEPEVLPVEPVRSPDGRWFAVSDGGQRVQGRWTPEPLGATRIVGERLDLAAGGDTVRLGRLLAPVGIDVVVVVEQLAPVPYDGPTWPIDAGLDESLRRQLDLERVPGTPSFVVYRNTAAAGPVFGLDRTDPINRVELTDQLDLDLGRAGARRLDVLPGPGAWEPTASVEGIDGEQAMLVATSWSDRWRTDAGTPEPAFDGVVMVPGTEPVRLGYDTPWSRQLVQLGVLVLVAVGALIGRRHDAPADAAEVAR